MIISICLKPFCCTLPDWQTTIGSARQGSQLTYIVTCDGQCSGLRATMSAATGDPDLYANENGPILISDYSYTCPPCLMCSSYLGGTSEDSCSNLGTQNGNRSGSGYLITTNSKDLSEKWIEVGLFLQFLLNGGCL